MTVYTDIGADITSSTQTIILSDVEFFQSSITEAKLIRQQFSTNYNSLFEQFLNRPARVKHVRSPLPSSLFTPPFYSKPAPWDFYKAMGSPKTMLAPMVRMSELAFRLLTAKYGAHSRHSPMLASRCYLINMANDDMVLTSNSKDSPLIIQVAGFDPAFVCLTALKALECAPHAAAIELNCGCPQRVARRGYYGAYLQDNWPLIQTILACLNEVVPVPVIVKIRRQNSIQETLDYAESLVNAGALMVSIHCRTREQRGINKGKADWSYAKELSKHLSHRVPIVLNGGIDYFSDSNKGLEETGCAAVMAGQGLLEDPALFWDHVEGGSEGIPPGLIDLALEYIDICETQENAMPVFSTVKAQVVGILSRYLSYDVLEKYTRGVAENNWDREFVFRDGFQPKFAYIDILRSIMDAQIMDEVKNAVNELKYRLINQIDGRDNTNQKIEEDVDFDVGGLFD
ncbi:hypothetical protein RCL1_002305 [Eukaryota sp. TZLM3-RCL]